jgi:hypothetical protein
LAFTNTAKMALQILIAIVAAAVFVSSTTASPSPCTALGNASTDWLVAPCGVRSQLMRGGGGADADAFVLRNGVVARALALDAATGTLFTRSLVSEANGGEEKLAAAVAEAVFEANGVRVYVGGNGSAGGAEAGAVRMVFTGAVREFNNTLAGNFSFTPGARGSRPGKAWPPAGLRVEFDHTVACSRLDAGWAAGALTATVVYELYDGTSAFSKRVRLAHTCPGALSVFNMTVSMLALARDRFVETFTDASIAEGTISHADAPPPGTMDVWENRFLPVTGSHAYDGRVFAYGPGLVDFGASDEAFTSYMCVELVHDADYAPGAGELPHGMLRFGLEAARMWRTLAPQTEQFPLAGDAMCVGGADLAGDPRQGSWCYDTAGTAGLEAYIDQAAALGFELIDVSLNMNNTWRSQVGVEFQSQANATWFKALVGRARAAGMELGAYDLLRNARSATAANQCAPDNAAELPLSAYDDMDLPPPLGTGLPCHNGGNANCRGGPGCCSLCAASEFYDELEASILSFWDATGMTVTEQDGAESNSPCANASHAHHHGLSDSIWQKWRRIHDTFRGYLTRGGFVMGMPGHWLEGGQSKVPGGYDEMTWSLPRWTWLHRQRERMIADPQERDRSEPNALRYFCAPFTPYHPVQVLEGGSSWAPVVGLESTATLEPLEEHTVELEWALSQSFGTGIFTHFRGTRLFGGPLSRAVFDKWTAIFKRYRQTLGADFVTLNVGTVCWGSGATEPTSTCTVSDYDAVLHRAPRGFYPDVAERAIAVLWNPTNRSLAFDLELPLYYAGLVEGQSVSVRREEGPPAQLSVGAGDAAVVPGVELAPLQVTYYVVEEEDTPALPLL